MRPRRRSRVRPSTEADLAAIQAIYAHHVRDGLASFEEVPPDARGDGAAAGGGGGARAAAPGGGGGRAGSLGYAYAGPYRTRIAYRFTVEDSVYVAPEATGRGLGRLLLARADRRREARGARQMVAVIGDSGNLGSIRLHARAGFREVGTLPSVGFKLGRWVDSVLMQRPLGPGDGTLPEG